MVASRPTADLYIYGTLYLFICIPPVKSLVII